MIPKPRKRIKDNPFLQWLSGMECIYCGQPAWQPHHVRWGEGPGHGSMGTRPDDYRALRCCFECHRALHGTDKHRLKWMTEKIGREDIYRDQVKQLMRWLDKQGGDMETLYLDLLDWLINRLPRCRADLQEKTSNTR